MSKGRRKNQRAGAWLGLVLFLGLGLPALPSFAAMPQAEMEEHLREMYEKIPSSRMLTDPDRLAASMERVNPEAAREIKQLIFSNPTAYDKAREAALALARHAAATRGLVYVSGVSGAGATVAKIFAEAGYQVEAYESRATPTREVQWGARQELIGAYRHYFGAEASEEFEREIVRPIGTHYKHMSPDFSVEAHPLPSPKEASSAALVENMTGHNIVSTSSVAAATVKDVETLSRKAIASDPNVHLVLGQASPAMTEVSPGLVAPAGQPAPTFVVLAEGAGSRTSQALGIKRDAITPQRLQVAGVIYDEIPGGNAVGATTRPHSDYTLVSGSLHRDGSGKIWFVTDLDPSGLVPGPAFKEGTPEFAAEKARLVEKQYRETASRVLQIPQAEMDKLKITGAVGGPLMPFQMQLGLSEQAVKGNMILVGDNVGNGHWASGAGGMVGMTAHPDAVANYLNDLERHVSPEVAAAELNRKLQSDSLAWIRAGIGKFWPDLPEDGVKQAFDRALASRATHPGVSLQVLLQKEIAETFPRSGTGVLRPCEAQFGALGRAL